MAGKMSTQVCTGPLCAAVVAPGAWARVGVGVLGGWRGGWGVGGGGVDVGGVGGGVHGGRLWVTLMDL